jgi:hypothetical protein
VRLNVMTASRWLLADFGIQTPFDVTVITEKPLLNPFGLFLIAFRYRLASSE